MTAAWVPDVLGAGFEQLTLELGSDEEGPVVATLVRHLAPLVPGWTGPLRNTDVLYVHGWSDYFFQTELARFWTGLGADFYALDLRKYGRSLRPGQTPGYVTDLSHYDADIGAALTEMGHSPEKSSRRRLVLVGHSTGGLTLTLWAARNPGRAAAIVLNSPWLELQVGAFARQAIAPLVQTRARFDPRGSEPAVDLGFYTRAQTEIGTLPVPGYQQEWRPATGFPTHPGWLTAILQGHRTIAAGVDVGSPVLVLLSKRSAPALAWAESMTSSDSVLVVDEIARAATRIGALVTVARVDGAIHDVFLSRPEPRAFAYSVVERWMTEPLGHEHPPRPTRHQA